MVGLGGGFSLHLGLEESPERPDSWLQFSKLAVIVEGYKSEGWAACVLGDVPGFCKVGGEQSPGVVSSPWWQPNYVAPRSFSSPFVT